MNRNKTIWLYVIIAMLGSVLLYEWVRPAKTVVIKESVPTAQSVRERSSQYWGALRNGPPAAMADSAMNANAFTQAAASSRPAVVYIKTQSEMPPTSWDQAHSNTNGSGVIISPEGYIATNRHVVEDADEIEIILNDRRKFQAQMIGSDPATDLALLKIEAGFLPYLSFGNSDAVQVGEWVLAVGNPFRLQSTVTAGIVSAKARSIEVFEEPEGIESFIQTDAAVNQGNSGGALVNLQGELIGINTAIITFSGRYEGYSFAVPSNLVQKVISDLIEFGTVHRGLLGVEIGAINDELASDLGLNEVSGVLILAVRAGSAAREAGIQKGDIIRAVNRRPTATLPQLMEKIGQFRPGDSVQLSLIRDQKQLQRTIVLRNHLNTTDLVKVRSGGILREYGLEVRDLIRSEKEVLPQTGVKVVSVYRSSAVDRTKMDPGFIITHINEKRIERADQFIELLKKAEDRIVLQGYYEQYEGPFWYVFSK